MDAETVRRPAGPPRLAGGRRTLNTSITADQEQKLVLVARLRNTDKAKIVREALDAYFASFFACEYRKNQHSAGENQEPAA